MWINQFCQEYGKQLYDRYVGVKNLSPIGQMTVYVTAKIPVEFTLYKIQEMRDGAKEKKVLYVIDKMSDYYGGRKRHINV